MAIFIVCYVEQAGFDCDPFNYSTTYPFYLDPVSCSLRTESNLRDNVAFLLRYLL